VLAWLAALAVVLGSPLVGDLRSALLRAFPQQYVAIISSGVVLGAALTVGICLRAIRTDRPRRIGFLVLAVAVASVSFAQLRSGNANVDAVEAFHFVEYGVLTLLFFPFGQPGRRWEAYVQAALATTVVAVADEWFQWFVPGRAGEWHDVMFDLLATVCGLFLCLALDFRAGFRRGASSDAPDTRSSWRLALRASSVVLLLGAFIATIHLGTEIRNPEIGAFRSRFSDARLRELGAQRARDWGGGPPPVIGRYGREDQYEAEALWHVRRRNVALDQDRKGDPVELDVAWHENLILEHHFTAVLDAASAGGAAGHRLAPEQVADLDARRAHRAAPFVSDAEAMPIYTWPPVRFWAVVVVIALGAGGIIPVLRTF
jgi:VanZ family protein